MIFSLTHTYLQIATVIWLFVWNQTLVSGFSASHTSDIATSRSYDAPPQTNTAAAIKTKWLIVGGGIHGVHISARLLGSGVVSSIEDICIIDGHDELLQSWKRRTRGTGMEYLRSSAGYHLDLNENSLRSFDQKTTTATASEDNSNINIKKRGKNLRGVHKDKQRRSSLFSNDYERPRLDFFNNHCDEVKVQVSMVDSCEMVDYHAKQIVLALGNAEPSIPAWVDESDLQQNGLVTHLLEDNNIDHNTVVGQSDDDSCNNIKIAIIGGGITAAHKALQLARKSSSNRQDDTESKSPAIHLISRHPLREQQFDTHQDWMMDQAASKRSKDGGGYGLPKKQVLYQKCDCLKERRQIIAEERIPGTLTPAVYRGDHGLKYAIQKGEIGWHQAYVVEKERVPNRNGKEDDQMILKLSCGESIQVDRVLLATGFDKILPGGKMIQNLINDNSELNVSDFCGYPIVSEHLRWSDRVFVAGALAELELGPSARNIAGARLAAERIVQAFVRA
ncbi:hypothetical protein QTG54_005662 [Skeletonema marinoi]|uniref:L-ornithine N(5)-monooxygenase n=1 Tax=Skeletonema marinoi TaxID=267567 RepID=A0AAD8YFK5_9STRA|nr:hypothetical protein QTG54_005662 [Skeletonema marinoi]